jgi:hypothetical protein
MTKEWFEGVTREFGMPGRAEERIRRCPRTPGWYIAELEFACCGVGGAAHLIPIGAWIYVADDDGYVCCENHPPYGGFPVRR